MKYNYNTKKKKYPNQSQARRKLKISMEKFNSGYIFNREKNSGHEKNRTAIYLLFVTIIKCNDHYARIKPFKSDSAVTRPKY